MMTNRWTTEIKVEPVDSTMRVMMMTPMRIMLF